MDPFARRVQLFTGKGGVGKSTIVAAMAVEAARRGHRPLIVELGHRASMEEILGARRIGYEPREVAPGVHALNVEFDASIRDYLVAHVKVRAVVDRVTRSTTLRRFFQAAPAVAEVATLHKLDSLERDRRRFRPAWHPIYVDLDATGHALMFLELPRVFDGIARAGPLRRALDRLTALLEDRDRTELHLVTLPADLPVQETIELHAALTERRGVRLGWVVVNGVPEPALDPRSLGQLEVLEARARRAGARSLLADAALARRAAREHARALRLIRRLEDAIRLPSVQIPRLAAAPRTIEALGSLGARLARQLEAAR